ncbi:MAG: tetratricopeptide repeat protein, partial [Acidobacteriota bacterium]|nr:tetratricopeptide repeat protein [Acidobacteriota bacterium]
MPLAASTGMRVIAPLVLSISLSASADAGQTAQPGRSSGLSSVAARVSQGRAFLEAGELERARATLEAAVAQEPASADGHYLLGLVAERRKDLAAAAAAFTNALQYAPAMAEAHDRRGFVLGQQGKTAEALSEFARAVQLKPSFFDAQYHLGA